jgi:Tfp pilus assembly protein PilN
MSFLPEDYLARKIAQRTNIIFVALFAVVLCVIGTAFFVTNRQAAEKRDELVQVNRELEEKRAQLEQIEALHAQEGKMKQKANVTAALRDRVPKSSVFAELINNMPATLSLTELDLETEALKTKPAARTALQREKLRQEATGQEEVEIVPTVVQLALVGVAPTDVEISEYIGALNAHPMFDDVALQFVEAMKVEEDEMRKFRVEMQLSEGFDLAMLEPTRADRNLEVDPMGDTLQIDAEGRMVKPTETLGNVETTLD